MPSLSSCPGDERKTLADGVTGGVPYPKKGFNCNPYGINSFEGLMEIEDSFVQKENKPGDAKPDPAKIAKACKDVKPF